MTARLVASIGRAVNSLLTAFDLRTAPRKIGRAREGRSQGPVVLDRSGLAQVEPDIASCSLTCRRAACNRAPCASVGIEGVDLTSIPCLARLRRAEAVSIQASSWSGPRPRLASDVEADHVSEAAMPRRSSGSAVSSATAASSLIASKRLRRPRAAQSVPSASTCLRSNSSICAGAWRQPGGSTRKRSRLNRALDLERSHGNVDVRKPDHCASCGRSV